MTTDDIKKRMIGALKPIGGDSEFFNLISGNPDLYGPIWILITWVFLLAVCVIIERFFAVRTLERVIFLERLQDSGL